MTRKQDSTEQETQKEKDRSAAQEASAENVDPDEDIEQETQHVKRSAAKKDPAGDG